MTILLNDRSVGDHGFWHGNRWLIVEIDDPPFSVMEQADTT